MTIIVTNSFMRYLRWTELTENTTIYITANGTLLYTLDLVAS
jgi:hypothetical protein